MTKERFYELLHENGFEYITGVTPESLTESELKDLIEMLKNRCEVYRKELQSKDS